MAKKDEAEAEAEVIIPDDLGPLELLQMAAAMLDEYKGSHSDKHYRILAEGVRALAARI